MKFTPLSGAERLGVSRADIENYLDMLFGYADFTTAHQGCIVIRGVGEKGTQQEGVFSENEFIRGDLGREYIVEKTIGAAERWANHRVASFVIPAVMDLRCLEREIKPGDEAVKWFTTLVVDIDKGDTDGKLQHATRHLGPPSLVVSSGGTTETGQPKRHLYWRLQEPSDKIELIAKSRKTLALKLGGDTSFGRMPQVIRIPGSVYGKNNISKRCTIDGRSLSEYDLEDLLIAIDDMPYAPDVEEKIEAVIKDIVNFRLATGGLNFGAYHAAGGDTSKSDVGRALVTTIQEGGEEDRNRWSEFNKVAGHHIHAARVGSETLEEAKNNTEGWMKTNMVPPWPSVRFETEWKSLLNVDIQRHGAMPIPFKAAPLTSHVIDLKPGGLGNHQILNLSDWAVDTWEVERPTREFLVKGMILAGQPHLLAAEGGAGKTFLLLDLALKVATFKPGDESQWCGAPLLSGGTVVMFTTEDDKKELRIRLSDIDKPGSRFKTNGKLIIVPTINTGGAFPLVQRTPGTGTSVRSNAWNAHLAQLEGIKDLKLVVIDTLNTTLHGEENNATVINEYMQAATAPICGKFGAALVITHHTRKPGANSKIYSADDMKNSIRGSSALIGAFRAVLGVWHAPDYAERLKSIGREPGEGQLYNFAVVKANNPEMIRNTRTLLRDRNGLLSDITDQENVVRADLVAEIEAWVIHCFGHAAELWHPFTTEGKSGLCTAAGRKHKLPQILQNVADHRLVSMVKRLVAEDRLVKCNVKGAGGKTYAYIDVPNGAIVRNAGPAGNAYEIDTGADFDPPHPSWEMVFAYHPSQRNIVLRKDLGERQIRRPQLGVSPPAGGVLTSARGIAADAEGAADTSPHIPYNPGISDG